MGLIEKMGFLLISSQISPIALGEKMYCSFKKGTQFREEPKIILKKGHSIIHGAQDDVNFP